MQLPSWLSCLPMLPGGGLDADLARMGRMKTLLSASAVNLSPVHGEWRGQPLDPENPPVLLLLGRRGQPAGWSPFANDAGNYNVAVTGKSGSGKSVLMQELVCGLVAAGGEAVVIDDGRSFQHTAEALGGAFIQFGRDSACLNPFAMIDSAAAEADDDYREECFSMLAGVVRRMCRRRGAMDDIEAALIDDAIACAWNNEGNGADLGHVRVHLTEHADTRARDMGLALGPWCPGGASGRLFAGSNVPALDAAFTVFELAELKGRADVQAVVLMLVVFLATQRMYHGERTVPKAIVIDEAWDLLSGEDSRAFIEGAARRARKYRGALVTGTQSVNDYYANPAARAAWDNADWVIFLSQKDESVELLKAEKRIHCDPGMERALKSLRTAAGRFAELVLHGPDGWRVARLVLDRWSVALFSSRGPAFAAVEKLKSQGLSTGRGDRARRRRCDRGNGVRSVRGDIAAEQRRGSAVSTVSVYEALFWHGDSPLGTSGEVDFEALANGLALTDHRVERHGRFDARQRLAPGDPNAPRHRLAVRKHYTRAQHAVVVSEAVDTIAGLENRGAARVGDACVPGRGARRAARAREQDQRPKKDQVANYGPGGVRRGHGVHQLVGTGRGPGAGCGGGRRAAGAVWRAERGRSQETGAACAVVRNGARGSRDGCRGSRARARRARSARAVGLGVDPAADPPDGGRRGAPRSAGRRAGRRVVVPGTEKTHRTDGSGRRRAVVAGPIRGAESAR